MPLENINNVIKRAAVKYLTAPTGPTYEDFQAHINTLAVDGSILWTGSFTSNSQRRRVVVGGAGGGVEMEGSTWQANTGDGQPLRYGIQHGLPSQAVFNAQLGSEVYYETQSVAGPLPLFALNRNGYQSLANASVNFPCRMVDLIYWDGTQAQRMNPFAGTGPTPYIF